MDFTVAAGLFVIGLGLLFYFTEELIKGVVGASLGLGITSFIVSIVFIGLEPENLVVGITGALAGSAGIAMGSIIGAAMIIIALSFGLRALLSPVTFQHAPKRVIAIPLLAQILLGLLGLDGLLSRTDGSVLLLGFVLSVLYVLRLSKRGLDVKPTGEVLVHLEKGVALSRRESLSLIVISIIGLIIGSQMLVAGSKTIIGYYSVSDTAFGMTVLALAIGLEELVRELPAALKKKSEISYENIVGTVIALFLFNGGIIASIKPVPVSEEVLVFYLPLCIVTTFVISLFMLARKVPRLGGVLLIVLYLVFFLKGFIPI